MLLRTVLRAASAWFIWRWLAPRWRSTLALVLGWWLVSVLHGEYVEYVQITERIELLWLSYVVKWLVVLAGISAYLWFSVLAIREPPTGSVSASPSGQTPGRHTPPQTVGDGFDFLREKKTLSSRADKLLDQHPSQADRARSK